jgi:hypothetical protein
MFIMIDNVIQRPSTHDARPIGPTGLTRTHHIHHIRPILLELTVQLLLELLPIVRTGVEAIHFADAAEFLVLERRRM